MCGSHGIRAIPKLFHCYFVRNSGDECAKLLDAGSCPVKRSVEDVHGYLFQPVVAFYASLSEIMFVESLREFIVAKRPGCLAPRAPSDRPPRGGGAAEAPGLWVLRLTSGGNGRQGSEIPRSNALSQVLNR